MNRKAVFTICAKNYLAQALTLKHSVLQYNEDVDFYLFLADGFSVDIEGVDVVKVDGGWLPSWQEMAFKYNVIEFSTSIKPFCFDYLFKKNYEKVIYLDPDIFVTGNLGYIFQSLDNYSMVITPHYNHIQTHYTGSVPEEELSFVGIYNLGFGALKNDSIGMSIIEWWKNRLYDKCYADKEDALHVDQRWIDFIPGFFPEMILISHHPGLNIAIWNLHERELMSQDDAYNIRDLVTGKIYPLLFFHFSGFDPFDRKLINRRHPKYNIETYPSFKPIINQYADLVYKNGYETYSKLKYSFNFFKNGYIILPLHRRLYRVYLAQNERINEDPFDIASHFYLKLKSAKLLIKDKTHDYNLGIKGRVRAKASKIDRIFNFLTRLFIKVFGVKYYYFLIKYLRFKLRLENQYYLIDRQ